MKLAQIKQHLSGLTELRFELPDGTLVPEHFHVTEVGMVTRHFIDCGGTVRSEKAINFQLWYAEDTDHRLQPEKLQRIIALSEDKLGLEDLDVEVEYQSDTIGRYGLAFNGSRFVLEAKQTDCLAKDKCGIPAEKPKVQLSELTSHRSACCTPSSGCC